MLFGANGVQRKLILDTISKLRSVADRGMLIYFSSPLQAYVLRETNAAGYISSECNIVDPLTTKVNHHSRITLV